MQQIKKTNRVCCVCHVVITFFKFSQLLKKVCALYNTGSFVTAFATAGASKCVSQTLMAHEPWVGNRGDYFFCYRKLELKKNLCI